MSDLKVVLLLLAIMVVLILFALLVIGTLVPPRCPTDTVSVWVQGTYYCLAGRPPL